MARTEPHKLLHTKSWKSTEVEYYYSSPFSKESKIHITPSVREQGTHNQSVLNHMHSITEGA